MRIVESLSDEERLILLGTGNDLSNVARYRLTWRPKDLHVLRYENGRLVAKASILKHQVFVNGQPVWVAGVGGVVTVPAVQGRGHASAIMEYVAVYIRDHLGMSFGLLFCREALVRFYVRFGWHLIQDEVMINQPDGEVPSPLPVMVLACSAVSWPAGSLRLASEPW